MSSNSLSKVSRRSVLKLGLLVATIGSKDSLLGALPNIGALNSTASFDFSRLSAQQMKDQSATPTPSTAMSWKPLPGPQTEALNSQADELFYGGSAGGGKTDLLLGLALTQQWTSIVFRREYKQLRGVVERSRAIIGRAGRLNETAGVWRLDDGRMLELGAVEHEYDKDNFQGRPHAAKLFDELPQFTESQYRFLIGWNRTTRRDERVRVVGAGNPPTSADGEWVIERWGAWLDPQHHSPAEPGELRWYAMLDGEDVEQEDGTPFDWKGETIYPRSRTFIPARVADNPYLLATGYVSTLQGMPEPLRSQMLYGDFTVGTTDDAFQVIPTSWVRAAQARWYDGKPDDAVLNAIGADIAQGGSDCTALARRYGEWFAEVEKIPGGEIPDAGINRDHVERALAEGGYASIDVDGIGASTYHLMLPTWGSKVRAYAGSEQRGERLTDRSGEMTHYNVRAAAYWHLREMLDPSRHSMVALPPGREVLADLTAPRWTKTGDKIQIEKKKDIKARLGRSPDVGDALVMAAWTDPMAGFNEAMGQGMSYSSGSRAASKRPVRGSARGRLR